MRRGCLNRNRGGDCASFVNGGCAQRRARSGSLKRKAYHYRSVTSILLIEPLRVRAMMQRTAALIFTSILHSAVCSGAVWAGGRVALVIGNSAYQSAAELPNPKNDAEDMAAALQSSGFDVIQGTDLDKISTDRKLRDFSERLSGADVGVFFYAGHGLQVNGINYLVPVDAGLRSNSALEFETVRLDLVQRIMEQEAKTNILFIDACRNNPLTRNLARAMGTRSAAIGGGLAPAESGVGTLISFSTQPGNVALDGTGRNSPFAGPLIRAIVAPGEDVLSVLTRVRNEVLAATNDKQVPWENHALRARFYFNGEGAKSPAQPSSPELSTASDAAREWSEIDKTSLSDLETFVSRHSGSTQAAYARTRIKQLERALAEQEASKRRTREEAARLDRLKLLEAKGRASEERQARAAPEPEPESEAVESFRVASNVSQGVHNMRTGPGTGHSLVISLPAGSAGVRISLSTCCRSDDGHSKYRWCRALWRGSSGWVSMGGLVR